MKKVFISVPMRGRTDEAIKNSIEKMHKIAELYFGEELEVIHNHCEYAIPDGANQSIYCLGYSIQKLAEADYFIGITYTSAFKGCQMESDIAHAYGIKCANISLYDADFLKDAVKIEHDCCSNIKTCTY